ncbi:MAG: tRNA (adenosine(37)-N6)-dimethylallyltransferase MiaA [Acidimicrobiia bacterium]
MNPPSGPRRPVAIVGATATGKSALAHVAARIRADVELVSIDAMQVYRGLDIGTAKPTAAERAELCYHGIDLVEPSETFSVADFVAAYDRALAGIAGRGHRPLIVGGTGLYLRAITDGLDLAGSWPDLRAELEAETDIAALYERLRGLDPLAAERIEPANQRRIVRALEVCIGSGRSFSSYGPGLTVYGEPRVEQIGLRWERAALSARIERRVRQMMADGLLGEVERLLAAPGGLSRTARQALGYKELIDHLEGRVALDQAVQAIVVRTRQFAVRQDRWFRRDPRIRWLDIDSDPVGEALPELLKAIDR